RDLRDPSAGSSPLARRPLPEHLRGTCSRLAHAVLGRLGAWQRHKPRPGRIRKTLGQSVWPEPACTPYATPTQPDTPLGLKPTGLSVQRPSHCHDSPKTLLAPLDSLGGVVVPMQACPTLQAGVPTDGHAVLHDDAAT